MSIQSVMPSNHLILCHPLLFLPSIFSSIKVFSRSQFFTSGGQSIGASASTSVLPINIPGLMSFRIDWFNLAVQETLKSLLQHHSLKASVLQHSAFFMVQLSHPYMTTGKTIVLTRRTFVGKVMSLLFNMLSGFVIKRVLTLSIQHSESPPCPSPWWFITSSPLFPLCKVGVVGSEHRIGE